MMAKQDRETAAPELVAAWPPLRRAAAMVGVAASSLSRRSDLVCERRGREERVRPAEVLRLARYYNRRSISIVASELLVFAYEQAPDYAPVVDLEIELTLGPAASNLDPEQFRSAVRADLPKALSAKIERAYRQSLANSESSSAPMTREHDLQLRSALHAGSFHRDSTTVSIDHNLESETSDG